MGSGWEAHFRDIFTKVKDFAIFWLKDERAQCAVRKKMKSLHLHLHLHLWLSVDAPLCA
jgi:hypothetical protein